MPWMSLRLGFSSFRAEDLVGLEFWGGFHAPARDDSCECRRPQKSRLRSFHVFPIIMETHNTIEHYGSFRKKTKVRSNQGETTTGA